MLRAATRSLFGLAPEWACQADTITHVSGGLLHRLFTLTAPKCGGLFSVALSFPRLFAAVSFHYRGTSCSVESGLSSPGLATEGGRRPIHILILYSISLKKSIEMMKIRTIKARVCYHWLLLMSIALMFWQSDVQNSAFASTA